MDDYLEFLLHRVDNERVLVLHLPSSRELDYETLARGVSEILPQPAWTFRFEGDVLRPDDRELMLSALKQGQSVVLLRSEPSNMPYRLAQAWYEFSNGDRHTDWSIDRNFAFRGGIAENPGRLAVIYNGPSELARLHGVHWQVTEEYVDYLLLKGHTSENAVIALGRQFSPSYLEVTMKDLYFLHERDPKGTQPQLLNGPLVPRAQASWTDVQYMLRSSIGEEIVDWLHRKGNIDDEKFEYFLAATDFLDRGYPKVSEWYVSAAQDIYHVLWSFKDFGDPYIYRGQFQAAWPLQATLYRPPRAGQLDIRTLHERVNLTETFLRELKHNQTALFGTSLDDDSLLAIAQHFGFPTPMLDFTRSLKIAAFFATLGAHDVQAKDQVFGVVYYVRPVKFIAANDEKVPAPTAPPFDITGVRVGKVEMIEPKLPDEENRIHRQQAVFVNGFNPRDLQNIIIGAKYFQQRPGLVFEDHRDGVTREILLPQDTTLTDIAESVRRRFAKKSQSGINYAMGRTIVSLDQSIVGSMGELLNIQAENWQRFFEELSSYLESVGKGDALLQLNLILVEYYRDAKAVAGVSRNLPEATDSASTTPISKAVSRLAKWSDVDEKALWDSVWKNLSGAPSYISYGHPTDMEGLLPNNWRERATLACALYLAGWEHLRFVDGKRARSLHDEAIRWLTSKQGLMEAEMALRLPRSDIRSDDLSE